MQRHQAVLLAGLGFALLIATVGLITAAWGVAVGATVLVAALIGVAITAWAVLTTPPHPHR